MKELSGRPKLSPLLARIDLRVLVLCVSARVCVHMCKSGGRTSAPNSYSFPMNKHELVH